MSRKRQIDTIFESANDNQAKLAKGGKDIGVFEMINEQIGKLDFPVSYRENYCEDCLDCIDRVLVAFLDENNKIVFVDYIL